jgi:PilZ domain-containing protein
MSLEYTGAEYLRHLKHTVEGQDELLQHASVPTPKEESPPPQERRRSTRYKCEGSAQFRVDGSDVHTWGTFTDLSLGGCYVELMATYPVGSVVDLLLELNGIRAHVKGEIRVSYPCLGMGIAFQEVSQTEQAKLADMIRSLNPEAGPHRLDQEPEEIRQPAHLPLITNAGAAVQALAGFFEAHSTLTKEDFIRILRKSQGADEFRDDWR